jgi:hypothetical protein
LEAWAISKPKIKDPLRCPGRRHLLCGEWPEIAGRFYQRVIFSGTEVRGHQLL